MKRECGVRGAGCGVRGDERIGRLRTHRGVVSAAQRLGLGPSSSARPQQRRERARRLDLHDL